MTHPSKTADASPSVGIQEAIGLDDRRLGVLYIAGKLTSMGEARRRGSRSPSAFEKARRFGARAWLLYPRPVRALVKFEAQIFLWGAGILAALILGAFALGFFHR